MAAWKLKESNDTWEDVCERAYCGEPQYLTRNGVSYRIVISLAQPNAAAEKGCSVLETLTSCPCDISELVSTDGQSEASSFDRLGGFAS